MLLIISNSIIYLLNKTGILQPAESLKAAGNMLPLYLAVSLGTGYREELFFRSYLLSAVMNDKNPAVPVAAVSLLFSLCHISQGYPGLLISFTSSIILSVIFLKHRNIHINAIAHAFFNFFILTAAVFSV
jgi:membrane protease YdiL (CAAX protease family)